MLMCLFAHSRFIENRPVASWETNPYLFRGGLSQLVSEQDRGKTHTDASKNRNNIIVVSLGGKLTDVFFYATMELHERMYVVFFGVLILFCC
jgi:hypothetical protein